MTGRNDDEPRGDFERVSLEELVGSSPAFAEQVRRSRDVLEGGSLVRRMREMADEGGGISQEELARRLGLSQARISVIEKGKGSQGPTYELLKRVARACGLNFEPAIGPRKAENLARKPAAQETSDDLEEVFNNLSTASKRNIETWVQVSKIVEEDRIPTLMRRRAKMWKVAEEATAWPRSTERVELTAIQRSLLKLAREVIERANKSSHEAQDVLDLRRRMLETVDKAHTTDDKRK